MWGKIRNMSILTCSTQAEADTPETVTSEAKQQSQIILEPMKSEAKTPHLTTSIKFGSFFF